MEGSRPPVDISPGTLRSAWSLPDDVCYLNHGSFGPSPRVVQDARNRWSAELERQPMDFFLRRMEGHLAEAAARLGRFVGAEPSELGFVDNATVGMNVVAASVKLSHGDEVLLTNHEYGAVLRIWRRACQGAGANVVVASLPDPLESHEAVVDALFASVTERTRLIVVSHITSPTAVILPVEAICRAARERGIPVCIDGPHAIAMVPVNLRKIGCDYYCASGHKWLSAPFGSGFLYVAGRRHRELVPPVMSWGRSVEGLPPRWQDEFHWLGTRDPATFLAIPAAIDFLESHGIGSFRTRTHALAREARSQLAELTGLSPFVPDDPAWFGSMVTCPLPLSSAGPPTAGGRDELQDALWERHRIEIPIVWWHGRRFIRVSCHLYNDAADLDRLIGALRELLPDGK